MSDVEEMVDATAARMWDEMVVKNGKEGGHKPPLWDATPTSTKREWRCAASHAMQSLGIPLETLAALKAGTWKAVPVSPTDDMARPLTRLWLLADQEPTTEDMQLARQYAAAVIASSPAKAEARSDK